MTEAIVIRSPFALLLVAALPLAAQQPRIVLDGQLGGDSARTRPLVMVPPNSYRIEVRPANADLIVRGAHSGRGYGQTLALNPAGDSLPGGRSYVVTPGDSATYSIVLAGVAGMAIVRVIEIPPAAGNVAAVLGRETLLLSEVVGVSPTFIELDTGIVYRFVVSEDADVYIAPRLASGAPVRLAPLVRGGGHGIPFMASQPGTYALTTAGGSTQVRVYRAAADAAEMACIRNPRTEGCRANPQSGQRRRSMLTLAMAVIAIPLAAVVLLGAR